MIVYDEDFLFLHVANCSFGRTPAKLVGEEDEGKP
jgi:hypothetical protein